MARLGHSSFDLGSLINPRSTEALRASPNIDRHTGRTVANLLRTGCQGRIYPANPMYDEVMGLACFPAIRSLPEPPGAAYALLRADHVLDVVRDCAEAGVRSIVVCTLGFAEEGGDGKAVQLEMARVARQHGSRVLGPNCIGVLDVLDSVVACPTFNITYDYKPGAVKAPPLLHLSARCASAPAPRSAAGPGGAPRVRPHGLRSVRPERN